MNLINLTHFDGDINIPQLGNSTQGENVTKAITQWQIVYLRSALGYKLTKEFIAGLDSATPDQKWLDLLKGVEYQDNNGNTRYWQGLSPNVSYENNTTGNFDYVGPEISPIAQYVFWHYQRTNATYLSGIGQVASNADNATRVSPIQSQVTAWNAMVQTNWELIEYLYAHQDQYGITSENWMLYNAWWWQTWGWNDRWYNAGLYRRSCNNALAAWDIFETQNKLNI